MSAKRLREAATLMRSRAEAATPGPWRTETYCSGMSIREPRGEGVVPIIADRNAEHIASWHPTVALAVADWIDSHARDLASAGGHLPSCDSPGDVECALAVANAYLGDAS